MPGSTVNNDPERINFLHFSDHQNSSLSQLTCLFSLLVVAKQLRNFLSKYQPRPSVIELFIENYWKLSSNRELVSVEVKW